eukprot:scaffold10043_cov27-Tisochrysis_lutea.AAC.1
MAHQGKAIGRSWLALALRSSHSTGKGRSGWRKPTGALLTPDGRTERYAKREVIGLGHKDGVEPGTTEPAVVLLYAVVDGGGCIAQSASNSLHSVRAGSSSAIARKRRAGIDSRPTKAERPAASDGESTASSLQASPTATMARHCVSAVASGASIAGSDISKLAWPPRGTPPLT